MIRRPYISKRVMGIEPTLSAWKAEVLPLNYTRNQVLEGEGFEPSKAEPSDLQSDPFDRSGTPPEKQAGYCDILILDCQCYKPICRNSRRSRCSE